MFSTSDTLRLPGVPPSGGTDEDIVALTAARLVELARLREFSYAQAERLMELPRLLPAEEAKRMMGKKGTIQQFDRITRAFRQIVVLEFELRGLFDAPDRDAIRPLGPARPPKEPFKPESLDGLLGDLGGKKDLRGAKTRPDYRTGPLDVVVAGVRKALGAEAPLNDPFAPPKEPRVRPPRREPVQPVPPRQAGAPPSGEAPAKPAPATVKLPEKAAVDPAMKAALLAIQALGGNGFRMPATKSKAPRANPARPPEAPPQPRPAEIDCALGYDFPISVT